MICALILIVTIILSKTKRIGPLIPPKVLKIAIIVEVIGIIATLGEFLYNRVFFDNTIERPAVGEHSIEEELQYKTDDKTTDIVLDVPAMLHSSEEKEELIEKAKEEIDDSFIGDNEDLDNINQSIVMKENYADGLVKAEWQLSDYKIVGAEGEINYDNVSQEKLINADVTLTCEDMSDVYSFSFRVIPLDMSSTLGIDYYVRKALDDMFESSDKQVSLPDKVGEKEVSWSKKYTFLGAKIGILGVLAAVAMIIGQAKEEKNKKERYLKSMVRDYPKIVESLSLYVGAGLSIKNALYRISEEYVIRRSKKKEVGFEGILRICREIEEGRSEIKAFENLANYCPTREYRRLSNLLISSIKKGTKGMLEQLESEEAEAFEMQKQYVKIAGEEASTKMLFPMIGLLGIVLVIIIAPSILNMQSM